MAARAASTAAAAAARAAGLVPLRGGRALGSLAGARHWPAGDGGMAHVWRVHRLLHTSKHTDQTSNNSDDEGKQPPHRLGRWLLVDRRVFIVVSS